MYQISGTELIYEWLRHENDADARLSLLEWLGAVCEDPPGERAQRVPGQRAPVYSDEVRLTKRRLAVVTFLVADQFRTVHIVKIRNIE